MRGIVVLMVALVVVLAITTVQGSQAPKFNSKANSGGAIQSAKAILERPQVAAGLGKVVSLVDEDGLVTVPQGLSPEEVQEFLEASFATGSKSRKGMADDDPGIHPPKISLQKARRAVGNEGFVNRQARGVYQGIKLTFYENSFSNVIRSFTWNQDDPKKIMLLSGVVPYLSEDGGKTFQDISSRLPGFSQNYSAIYGGNSGGFGVRSIFRSPADHNNYIFFGKGTNIWKSTDGGLTFRAGDVKAGQDPLYLRYVSLHPTRKDVLQASHIDAHCLDGTILPTDPLCSYEVYLSRDFGTTWSLVSTHVWSLFWGTYRSATGVFKDSIYFLVSDDQGSHQIGVGNGGLYTNADQLNLVEVVIDTLASNEVRRDVDQMLSIGEYVYIIAKPPGSPASTPREVLVSHLGNTFRLTSFPGANLRGLTFMDVSEGSVFVMDSPSWASATYADHRGDLWTSDSTGTYFTRSLQRVVLQSSENGQVFDLHKVSSLEGTYIATVVGPGSNDLRTKITWNRGGTWHDVKSLDGLNGLVDESVTPFVLYGDFHSSNARSHLGIYSERSSPGMVLAVGSYGVGFVNYITGTVMWGDIFYSRNGGKTFAKILAGIHFCRVLDEGGVITCLPGDGPTTRFLYSVDSGVTWQTETFSDRPVSVLWVTSDPDGFGLVAMIIALDGSNILFISTDLADLGLRTCGQNDYERWMPSDGQDERQCVLGHHDTYLRLKADADCFSSLDSFVADSIRCPCGQGDFECAAGYFYNVSSTYCSPESNTPVQIIQCQNGFYTKYFNYRLIPGDTCDLTLPGAIDLTAGVQTECPVEDLINDNNKKKALALGLGLGLTFLGIIVTAIGVFIVWSAKKGHLRYQRVRTHENDAVELDAPDHPDEDDEESQDQQSPQAGSATTQNP